MFICAFKPHFPNLSLTFLMFRNEYCHKSHKCAGCLQYLMLAASPLYLSARLNDEKSPTLVEGLFEDLISARFGIVLVGVIFQHQF